MEKILKDLFGLSFTDVNQFLVKMGTQLVIAILILVIGFWFAKMVSKGIKKILRKSSIDEGLVTFLSSLLSMIIKVLVLVTSFTELGIEMTSFVALLGAAGLAIGMAFSGTLSNFAGGVMILVLKPFKVNDLIMIQGELGVVKEIQIFNTYLHTPDNKVIILPNGPVANGNIINYTKADKRRVDWTFSIAYGDDLKKAKELLEHYVKSESRILKEEDILIALGALAESSVDLVVRAWVKTDDYWPVFYALNERVYNEFEKEGLHFPFPQMDVHLEQKK